MNWLRNRVFPQLLPEEHQRRMQLFRTLLFVQLVSAVILIAVVYLDTIQDKLVMYPVIALAIVVNLLAVAGYLLARRAKLYHIGAIMLILSLEYVFGLFTLVYGSRGPIPFFLVWPIVVANMLVEPLLAMGLTAIAGLIYAVISWLEWTGAWIALPLYRADLSAVWHTADPFIRQRYLSDSIDVVVLYLAIGFLSWIASRSLRRAVDQSREWAQDLNRYRGELEVRVEARTAELSQAMDQLKSSMEIIREVGSPVLPIMDQVLLAPIIGAVDSERAAQVMNHVLNSVSAQRAKVVIVDITGVPIIDTAVANALVQTAQGIRLLGAKPVLVGIRSEVAQTIVDLGIDLRGIVTRAGLQEGLEYALETIGGQITLDSQSPSLPLAGNRGGGKT